MKKKKKLSVFFLYIVKIKILRRCHEEKYRINGHDKGKKNL